MILLIIYFIIGLIICLSLLNLKNMNNAQKLAFFYISLALTVLWLPIILLLGYLELKRTFL